MTSHELGDKNHFSTPSILLFFPHLCKTKNTTNGINTRKNKKKNSLFLQRNSTSNPPDIGSTNFKNKDLATAKITETIPRLLYNSKTKGPLSKSSRIFIIIFLCLISKKISKTNKTSIDKPEIKETENK